MAKRGTELGKSRANGGGLNKTTILIGAIVLAFIAGFGALVWIDSGQRQAQGPVEGAEEFEVASGVNNHTPDTDTIQQIVKGQDCLLASPYPGLPEDTPVVASAWGAQLRLESADDSNLERFVNSYRKGPQTPEPGATCSGGTSDTVAA
ncbi:MAG: DUF3105 domain-containing protein [Actinobacteria bacterium]|nr:DUF3105 domain-containing protein [Actinomycetota bacterium]